MSCEKRVFLKTFWKTRFLLPLRSLMLYQERFKQLIDRVKVRYFLMYNPEITSYNFSELKTRNCYFIRAKSGRSAYRGRYCGFSRLLLLQLSQYLFLGEHLDFMVSPEIESGAYRRTATCQVHRFNVIPQRYIMCNIL